MRELNKKSRSYNSPRRRGGCSNTTSFHETETPALRATFWQGKAAVTASDFIVSSTTEVGWADHTVFAVFQAWKASLEYYPWPIVFQGEYQ